jgi:hypothetical protein
MSKIAIIVLVVISISGVSCVDKKVDCKAKLLLTIINTLPKNVTIKLVDSSKIWYNSVDVQIQIGNDSVVIMPSQTNVIPIEYKWTSLNSCEFTNGDMNVAYRLDVKLFLLDSLIFEKNVFHMIQLGK